MANTYGNLVSNRRAPTPQTQPVKGRESEMIQGKSGGYAFKADIFDVLKRCLVLGTTENGYYAGAKENTEVFEKAILEAAAKDANKTAELIVEASNGLAMKNHAPIFALTTLSTVNSEEAKKAFEKSFSSVVRNASQFYEWFDLSRKVRGSGRLVRRVAKNWLTEKTPKQMAYQLLKYKNRNGYTNRDVLRLVRPKAENPELNEVFKWAVKGWETLPSEMPSIGLQQIYWAEFLKKNPDKAVDAIRQGNLTMEMVGNVKLNKDGWQVIFENMPMGALIRNLSTLTRHEILTDAKNIKVLREKLLNQEVLKKARIHPMDLLRAMKAYESGGRFGVSKHIFTPNQKVLAIIEDALNLSFSCVEKTGKSFRHYIDVSGSMCSPVENGMSAKEVAGIMALSCLKAEDDAEIMLFHDRLVTPKITKNTDFRHCMDILNRHSGGTDCSLMFQDMLKKKEKADCIIGYTDNESWAGYGHTYKGLQEYRKKINAEARVIYCSLCVNSLVLTEPGDKLTLDVCGFDPQMPKLIAMFAKGEI